MRRLPWLLALALPMAAPAQTLMESVHLALAQHPRIEAATQTVAARVAAVRASEAAFKPELLLSGEVGRSTLQTTAPFPESGDRWPNTLSLVLSQPLYTGGALGAAVETAKLSAEASQQQREATRVDIAIQAIAAHASVVRDQALLDLYTQSIAALRQAKSDTDKRFQAGEVTKTDTAQADARLAEAEAQRAQAEATLAVSRAQYRRVTGATAQDLDARLPELAMPADLEHALAQALQSPTLQAQHQQALAARTGVTAARAGDKARVSVEARATTQDNTDFGYDRLNGWGLYLKAQLPLYEGGRTDAKVAQAQAEAAAAQAAEADTAAELTNMMTSAWQHWLGAQAQVPAYQAQVRASELALDSTRKELKVGTRTTLDLLDAERDLLAARIHLLLSEQDRSLAGYRVLAVIGDLSVLEVLPSP